MAYVARPELGEGLRSCAHGRYVIFFRPSPIVVRIERILHGARDMSAQIEPPEKGGTYSATGGEDRVNKAPHGRHNVTPGVTYNCWF